MVSTGPSMRPVLWLLGCLAPRREDRQEPEAAPTRRRASSGATLALAGGLGSDAVETLLQSIANAVAHFTGAGALLAVVDGAGAVERMAAADADGCARETLTR